MKSSLKSTSEPADTKLQSFLLHMESLKVGPKKYDPAPTFEVVQGILIQRGVAAKHLRSKPAVVYSALSATLFGDHLPDCHAKNFYSIADLLAIVDPDLPRTVEEALVVGLSLKEIYQLIEAKVGPFGFSVDAETRIRSALAAWARRLLTSTLLQATNLARFDESIQSGTAHV